MSGATGSGAGAQAAAALDAVAREQWGRILSALIASTRRLDLAEDALGDAVARAAERWPRDGVPDAPDAWLLTTARRRVIDVTRSEAVALRRRPELVVEERDRDSAGSVTASHRAEERAVAEIPDDRMRLLFLCAHPALDAAARAALSLRLVIGVPTAEIARLFLVQPSAMSARLTRAKKRVVAAGMPLALPSPEQRAARVESVLRTSYLAFTAGYQAAGAAPGGPDGDGVDGGTPDAVGSAREADLGGEAIRLTRVVRELLPQEPGAASLLALQLLQHSRRRTRHDDEGRLVLLADQDRTRWDREAIREAAALLDAVEDRGLLVPPAEGEGPVAEPPVGPGGAIGEELPGGAAGDAPGSAPDAATVLPWWPTSPYARTLHLEALIAFEHARAATAAATDWPRIAALYARLEELTGSPVVRLNRAVALAEASAPDDGLDLLAAWPGGVEELDAALGSGHRLPFVRADLLARAGRVSDALATASAALDRCPPGPEREHITRRIEALRAAT